MKKLIYLFALLLSFSGIAQNSQLFERANKAYAEENYQEAIDLYNQIINNGETSADLHYNLGNAHYKLNNIAPSIYHYEKALQLDPADDDIENNLAFARNMAIDAIDEGAEKGFSAFLVRSTSAFNATGWGWVAIFCMLCFVVFFLVYYFSSRTNIKRLLFIGSLFFLVLAISSAVIAAMKVDAQESSNYAIIFAEEAEVLNEPNARGNEVFTLHEGAKVEITEDFQDWVEIQLPNGSEGWMLRSQLKRL